MMEDPNNTDAVLTPEEKIRFRELTNKILTKQSSSEILSFAEKEALLQLLSRLDTLSHSSQTIGVSTTSSNEIKPINKSQITLLLFSLIAIFAATVGIPTLIVVYLTGSLLLAILTVISTTIISVLAFGAYLGKVNWGLLIFPTVFIAITFLVLLQIFDVSS